MNDPSIPTAQIPTGWVTLGKAFNVSGDIAQGSRISFGLPLPDGTPTNISPSVLTVLHYSGGQWVYVPVTQVQGNAAYIQASSFGPFLILKNTTANPVIYVDMEYMEFGRIRDGKSWMTAYLDLNDALADARVSKKEIWVAGGQNRFGKAKRYFHFARDAAETRDTLETAFELFNGARIYSGFRGNETDRLASRSYKDQYMATLTNGWGADIVLANDLHTIIWLEVHSPANRIMKGAEGAYLEGFYFDRAEFYNNHYINFNSTVPGMGVFIDSGSMAISNCKFITMQSKQPGGAIYAHGSPSLFIDSCHFGANHTDSYGGAISNPMGNLYVNRTSFLENSASEGGGAVDASPFGGVLDANHPDSAYKHLLVLRNCVLEGNTAKSGGALELKSTANIDNTVFAANVSTYEGGAITNWAGHLEARYCTFWVNDSPSGRAYSGQQWDSAIFIFPLPPYDTIRIPGDQWSSASFRNSILWNTAARTGPEVITNKQSSIEMAYTTAKNGYPGAFDFDPLFYNISASWGNDRTWFTDDDGLYLSRQSPAIDTAPELVQGPSTDILGHPRKTGARVDLGAYEYNRVPPQVHITSLPPRSYTCIATVTVTYSEDGQTGFTQSFSLTEGPNTLVISKSNFDAVGKDSVVVILDTQTPVLTLVSPSKDSVVSSSPLVVQYRVDNGPILSQSFNLTPKINALTITATDSAGNSASKGLRVYLAGNGQTGPSVVIVNPSKDTLVNRSPIIVAYTLDGVPLSKSFNLVEGPNAIIIDTTLFPGFSGADTVRVTLDTRPPQIVIASPANDTAVRDSILPVFYTVDGTGKSMAAHLIEGLNTIKIQETDSAGNVGIALRRVFYSKNAATPIVAKAKSTDTVFTYALFTLDAKESTGPVGLALTYIWKQILGTSVYINTPSSRVAGVVSRGPNRLRFELTVSDSSGFFASGKDTVTIEVLEPENELEYAQALEAAKNSQDGSFSLNIDPSGEGSRYTVDDSISLQGFLTGTTGALGTIRWTCNARTGTFQPLDQNWKAPAISLDPGDNWITLVYMQGSQIAVDRILVARGEVDMAGFDMDPNVLWADSAMNFKLVVNVNDPAVSNVHLIRITNRELDLGELVDDGTSGDDFASDGRYTLQFNLTPNADSVYWFRIKANKSGVNSYSAIYTFHPQQKYNPATFQNILSVHTAASALFKTLKATRTEKSAMDSVANWLIEQPSVAVAGIGPGEKAICWQYTNGLYAMISNAPAETRGSGKVKTKALSPYQFDGAFAAYDDGITGYRGEVIPAAKADTGLYDADSLLINASIPDSNVTIENWKNWGGYKAVMVAAHGNTFGYDSLSQIRWKPTLDQTQGKSAWSKPYVTVVTHVAADTSVGSKYWKDLTSGGKTFPRMIVVDIGYGPEYALTSKFFKTYNTNLKGSLLSFGSCRSLFNDELWNTIRANGDASTAMIGYSDYVKGNFAGKVAEIIFKSLVNGKTLRQSVDSVVTFCGQPANGFCTVKNGKAWDSTKVTNTNSAFLEYRGDSNYTLIPKKGRVWAWSTGSGRGLYSCASPNADTVSNIRNISGISGGMGHALALELNGTVWGWGWNGSAQLGLAPSGGGSGSPPTSNYKICSPVQVFPGSGYKAIAAGLGRSLAVATSGKVWRAGEYTGAASNQWTTNGTEWWMQGVIGVTPQLDTIPGLSNVVDVAAGDFQNLALQANGSVWAWGTRNSSGELGLGDTLPRNSPVQISGLSNIIAISAGENPSIGSSSHSLALDRSGKVWAWGENEFGQLGVGDTVDRSTPQPVSGLSHIKSISAGVGGSSAVDSSGKVWVWGWNNQGQLGLGNTNNQSTPIQIPGISNVLSVSHGMFPVILDNSGAAKWSCGSACGNTFVTKKPSSLDVGAGGDEFGMSIAP